MTDILTRKLKRKLRIRKKINPSGRLRFSVFRSGKHIYAQIIDDKQGKTLVSASDLKLPKKGTKKDKAMLVGEILGRQALEKGIKEVVFDKGIFAYHGRVKALAEAARKAGLKF